MTNIEFLEEHIRQLKEALFDDDMPPMIAESIETELKYWESILKELKALDVLVKYFNFAFYEHKYDDTPKPYTLRCVSIQSKEDEGCYDTTASADFENYKVDFETLKEVLE